ELIRDRYQIEYLKKIYSKMLESWENAIDMMKTSKEDVIVIGVGGGSIMLPETLKGSSKLVIPKNAQYANAIGCTLTKVGATIERTFSYDQTSRDTAIKSLIEEAKKTAISAGAIDTTIEVREIEELQMPYLPGNAIKVSVKVVGELKI
ncbi:hydantoinase subunit beta, partial [Sulfolobus sp. A20-N-G8]